MQIPSSAVAASVSTIASNTKAERSVAAEVANNAPLHVEKSGESAADRDAQGQGDGLSPRDHRKSFSSPQTSSETSLPVDSQPAPTLPDEPPSQLDLIG